jgi:hypothetical protein
MVRVLLVLAKELLETSTSTPQQPPYTARRATAGDRLPVWWVLKGLRAFKAYRGILVLRERMERTVPQDQQVPTVLQELLVLRDHKVLLARSQPLRSSRMQALRMPLLIRQPM